MSSVGFQGFTGCSGDMMDDETRNTGDYVSYIGLESPRDSTTFRSIGKP